MSDGGTSSIKPTSPNPAASKKTTIIVIAVVAILLVAIPLGYLATQKSNDNGQEKPKEVVITVVGKQTTRDLNLTALVGMSYIQAQSSFQNRFGNWHGLGIYKGVPLSNIADLVGGMVPGDVMTITATDNYTQNLTYYQVYADSGYQSIQGRIVLAYQFNDSITPNWTDGPEIAVLAPDKAFSNTDFNSTSAKDPEFSGSTSAGSLWVKNVNKVQIRPVFSEWTLQLTNLQGTTTNMTRTEFVALGYGGGW